MQNSFYHSNVLNANISYDNKQGFMHSVDTIYLVYWWNLSVNTKKQFTKLRWISAFANKYPACFIVVLKDQLLVEVESFQN